MAARAEASPAGADAGGVPDAPSLPGAEVVIDSVGKTFRRGGRQTVALDGASLRVRAGELACLLGPSGCGKSTLLRIIAGALAADEGTVTVGGRPVTGPSPDRGMLFQTPMLFGWLTTRNNILFGPRAQRAARRHERDDPELDEEATTLLDRVGLLHQRAPARPRASPSAPGRNCRSRGQSQQPGGQRLTFDRVVGDISGRPEKLPA